MGVEVSGELVTSILVVNNAVVGDAGSYSCTLPVFGNKDFPRARANVHLIYGESYWRLEGKGRGPWELCLHHFVPGDRLAVHGSAAHWEGSPLRLGPSFTR